MKTSTASLCSSNVVRFKAAGLKPSLSVLCRTGGSGGGGALHYCHGAQAPWVIKNKMIGLAIKLNRKQKNDFSFFLKICPKSIPKVGLQKGLFVCLSPCSNLNRNKRSCNPKPTEARCRQQLSAWKPHQDRTRFHSPNACGEAQLQNQLRWHAQITGWPRRCDLCRSQLNCAVVTKLTVKMRSNI